MHRRRCIATSSAPNAGVSAETVRAISVSAVPSSFSSTYGHRGAAYASIYVGAKHAVEGITKSVALELAKTGDSGECRRARAHGYRHANPIHRHGRE